MAWVLSIIAGWMEIAHVVIHPLPDGRIAESLDRFDLGRTLAALGVAGVDAGTPKFKALLAYSEHIEPMKAKAVVIAQEPKAV